MLNQTQFVVFTDLDGTLLDYNNYSYAPAIPGIKRLKDEKIPLVLVTSKTLSELQVLLHVLKLRSPVIAENGALLAFPKAYFEGISNLESDGDMEILRLSSQYTEIRDILTRIRCSQGFDFLGFGDMTTDQVVAATGLSMNKASQAKVRIGSEPIVWNDSAQAIALFEEQLKEHGLGLTRGGRFRHVMGDSNKGKAVQQLIRFYQHKFSDDISTIALGNTVNDLSMLAVVDTPVVVRRVDGSIDDFGDLHYFLAKGIGPVGWNEFIQLFLDRN